MGNAGRVLMIPKGDYNAATTYEMLDCVYYNGRSYVCKQTSTGNAPTNTTYWQVMTPDSSAEIQALTNKLTDEAETRAKLGAHNLFAKLFTSSSHNGIAYTANVDGTVSYNGQINASTYSTKDSSVFTLPAGSYILSKNPVPAAGSATHRSVLSLVQVGVSDPILQLTDKEEGTFTLNSSASVVVRLVFNGYGESYSGTFYPMIRLATDADPTYQPYAKTNVELTQDVTDVLPIVGDAIEITTTESFANLKNGITYKFSTSDTGSPFGGYNVAVKVAKVASTSGIQMAFKVVSAANTELDLLAIRPCLGGNYGAWRKFSGEIPT